MLIQEGCLFWPGSWGLLECGCLFEEIWYTIQCNNKLFNVITSTSLLKFCLIFFSKFEYIMLNIHTSLSNMLTFRVG